MGFQVLINAAKLALRRVSGQLQPIYDDLVNLWNTASVRPEYVIWIDKMMDKFLPYRSKYEAVANQLGNGIPWWFIMLCHIMEAGGKDEPFKYHLHCGDSLNGRTVNVPKGRPIQNPGNGKNPPSFANPYSWEESAIDALKFMNYDKNTDWNIDSILYLLEKYNGFGYRYRKINTPYLWSYTNHYGTAPNIGKFVADRKFDSSAISKQSGCAAIMLRMKDKGILTL